MSGFSKLLKILNVIRTTQILHGNKMSYFFFFFLTHCMNFTLRKIRPLGFFLKKVFVYLPTSEFIIKNSQGTWAVFPFNDGMTISADYFEEELRGWPGKVSQRRIFIDAGANIGKYTIIASNIFNYSQVLSIEPNPITADLLKRNITLNKLEHKTSVEQVAIGDTEGEVIIQSDSHHLGGANIVDVYDTGKPKKDISCNVKISTLDSIILNKKLDPSEIDFIKIDIERMEKKALEGMRVILASMPRKSGVMIEITNDRSKVIDILSNHGFRQVENIADDYLFIKA